MAEDSRTGSRDAYQPLDPDEEAALVEACTSGDARAWRRLVDVYGPLVYRGIKYFLRSYRESLPEEDALNVYQEMFLDLCADNFRKLKTFQGGGRLPTWLFTVARRQCLDYIRASSRLKRAFPRLAEPELLDIGQRLSEGSDPLTASETTEAVLDALNRLDEHNRLLIVLFYFEELSYEEIAKVMGISVNSVSAMLRRARSSIAKILE